jgi:hypothetical protein
MSSLLTLEIERKIFLGVGLGWTLDREAEGEKMEMKEYVLSSKQSWASKLF